MYRYIITTLLLFFFGASAVSACDPAPWSIYKLLDQSESIAFGKIENVSSNSRSGTLHIQTYSGPDNSYKIIELPDTKDSRSETDSCPDFSIKFEDNQKYLILFSELSSKAKYLNPKGLTAFKITNNQILINERGDTAHLDEIFFYFNHSKGYELKIPEESVNGLKPTSNNPNYMIYLVVFILICFLTLFISIRLRKK